MTVGHPPRFDNSLLKKALRDHLPDRVEHFSEVWQVICRYGWDRPILRKLRQGIKDLRDSTCGFGFIQVSERLQGLELCLQRIGKDPGPLDPLLMSEVACALEEVKVAIQETVVPRALAQRKEAKDALLCTAQWQGQRHIFCLVEDRELLTKLQQELEKHHYGVHVFRHKEALLEAIDPIIPAAVVLDIPLVSDLGAIGETLHSITEFRKFRVTQIFLSPSGDLTDRLRAMRLGGDACFSPPWNMAAIAAKLDELVLPQAADSYRVLVVDDDPAQAQFATGVLRKAGMQTAKVTEALQVMNALTEFCPDLILMDLYMPDADGMELTAIIREHDEFSQIPIVFLSGESDTGVQMDALAIGGEAFLAKPIRPRRLISSVREIIQKTRGRRRAMNSLAVDSD